MKEQIRKIANRWCEFDIDTDTMFFANSKIMHEPLREVEPFEEFLKDIETLLQEQKQETIEGERRKMYAWIKLQATYKNHGFHKQTMDGLIKDIKYNYLSKSDWLEEQKNDKRTPEERFKQEYVGEFTELLKQEKQ